MARWDNASWRSIKLGLRLRMADRTFPRPDLENIAKKVRVAVTPRDALLKARLANGAIVYGRNRPGFGGRAVYIYGDKYEPEFEHLERFLDDTGVFVEVGANTGKHSIKAAQHYAGNGAVVAIEPNPEILSILHRSVKANGFHNVRLRNFCIGDHKSAAVMWMNHNRPVMFSLRREDDSADAFSTLVLTLDELFEWEGLDRLDYLKVCAEGTEAAVIAGARKVIGRYRPIIQIEDANVDVVLDHPDYICFKPTAGSISKMWIPKDHPKGEVATELGWRRVTY